MPLSKNIIIYNLNPPTAGEKHPPYIGPMPAQPRLGRHMHIMFSPPSNQTTLIYHHHFYRLTSTTAHTSPIECPYKRPCVSLSTDFKEQLITLC